MEADIVCLNIYAFKIFALNQQAQKYFSQIFYALQDQQFVGHVTRIRMAVFCMHIS